MTAALCADAWPATEFALVQDSAGTQLLPQLALPLDIVVVLALLAKLVDSWP